MINDIQREADRRERLMVASILNNTPVDKEKIAQWFGLEQCDKCGSYVLSETIIDQYGTEKIELICEQCRERICNENRKRNVC